MRKTTDVSFWPHHTFKCAHSHKIIYLYQTHKRRKKNENSSGDHVLRASRVFCN